MRVLGPGAELGRWQVGTWKASSAGIYCLVMGKQEGASLQCGWERGGSEVVIWEGVAERRNEDSYGCAYHHYQSLE